jgi:hypothetical protein
MRNTFYLIPLFILLVGCSSDDEEYISNWDFIETYWANPSDYIGPKRGEIGYQVWFGSDNSFMIEYADIPNVPEGQPIVGSIVVVVNGKYDYNPPILTLNSYGRSIVYKVHKDKMELQGKNMPMNDQTDIQFPEELFLFDNTPPEE